jgi:drug/metabolite transporter (DMT)-like permease
LHIHTSGSDEWSPNLSSSKTTVLENSGGMDYSSVPQCKEFKDGEAAAPKTVSPTRIVMMAHILLFFMKGPGVGFGTVVAKIGLSHTNPIVFAFLRNAISAGILLPFSMMINKSVTLQRRHACIVLAGGLLLFATNLFYTVGLKLSSPVIGAAWQCMVPIIASVWAVGLGRETISLSKGCGLVTAIAGALVMIMLQPASSTKDGASDSSVAGNLCFLVNTNAYALYFIINKPLRAFYPASTLTAWSFSICAVLMLEMIQISSSSEELHTLVASLCVLK